MTKRLSLSCCPIIVALLLVSASGCAAGAHRERTILVFGDSLSAGYGIGIEASWPSLLDRKLQAQGYPYRVVNASVSGETTAGGARRIGALLEQHRPGLVIVELGANDGLRGLTIAELKRHLVQIVDACRHANAVPLLLKVRIPPNYGPQYTRSFEAAFDEVGGLPGVRYGPFLLERFAADRAAFQSDGLHPKGAYQSQILDTLWPAIKAALAAVDKTESTS